MALNKVDSQNAFEDLHRQRLPQPISIYPGGDHTSAKRLMARQIPSQAFPAVGSGGKEHKSRADFHAGPPSTVLEAESHIGTSLIPEVEYLLQEACSSWEFDMFRLADQTEHPLSILGFFLVKNAGLLDLFGISETVFSSFLLGIEEGYPWNSYHNRVHAASVLHMMHMLMCAGLMEDGVLEGITMLACYLSAIVHDFQHPGVNNDFLIKTRHPLAVTHNDASPLENHHISAAYKMQHADEKLSFAAPMSKQDESILRASCIEMVLGTDMKKHFNIVSCFQGIQPPNVNDDSTSAADLSAPSSQAASPGRRLGNLAMHQKLLIAQVALKCADLSHLASSPELHKRWVDKLDQEFLHQGDLERAQGLPISPLMDRSKAQGMSKSQVGFFEVVALPLFTAYQELMPESQPMLDNVRANYKQWHQMNAS